MKTSRYCPICNEKIEVVSTGRAQAIVADAVLDLQTHFHCKGEHGEGYLKIKGILKRLGFVFLLVIPLAIIITPLFYLTYPFWWIHEKLN
jgi:hypothetical protein